MILRKMAGVQILKLHILVVQIITHRAKIVSFDSAKGKEYFTLGAGLEQRGVNCFKADYIN